MSETTTDPKLEEVIETVVPQEGVETTTTDDTTIVPAETTPEEKPKNDESSHFKNLREKVNLEREERKKAEAERDELRAKLSKISDEPVLPQEFIDLYESPEDAKQAWNILSIVNKTQVERELQSTKTREIEEQRRLEREERESNELFEDETLRLRSLGYEFEDEELKQFIIEKSPKTIDSYGNTIVTPIDFELAVEHLTMKKKIAHEKQATARVEAVATQQRTTTPTETKKITLNGWNDASLYK